MQTSPIQIQDFSGGITDNFIDAPLNKYKTADNFLITENKKLYTRYGLGIYNDSDAQLPSGNQRVGHILSFEDVLFAQSGAKIYYDAGALWTEIGDILKGLTVNDLLVTTSHNKQVYAASSSYLPVSKMYADAIGDYQIRTAGMPPLASSPTGAGAAGTDNYLYAFHYYYEYAVGTVTHIDAGPTTEISVLQTVEPSVSSITLSSIPVFTSGSDQQYDDANIKVKIYRTAKNDTTLYLLATINNGVTSYVDSISDATVITGPTIYTTGGVQNNDTPPKAKAIHIVGGAMYYGNIKIGTAIRKNRVLQSVLNDPDSVPATNYIDLEDEVVGISSYMDRPLVFCKNSVYRLEGTYDELGNGGITYDKIADTIGCVSESSIIQTPLGIFFASTTGFAYTDGFKCFNVSDDFNTTYSNLVVTQAQKDTISATFDKVNNRVFFSAQTSESAASENDKVYVCDLRWGISRNMSFTTFSGSEIYPTFLSFHKGELIHGDYRGYIMAYREEYLSDKRIDTLIAPASWGDNTIIYNYETAAVKPFPDNRFFMPKVIFSAKNSSNLSLQIISNTDIGNRLRTIKPLRWRGNWVWGDYLFVWGMDNFQWGVQGFIEHQRYFHGDDLRGTYKQLQMTNAEVLVLDSDSLSQATCDVGASTVTLDDPLYNWLDDMLTYSIYFEGDNYERGYPIVSHTSTVLTVLDVTGSLPLVSSKWIVKGKPKNEILSLIGITLLAAPLGQTQDRYSPSQDGGNA